MNYKIFNSDCFEVMRNNIDSQSVSLIITSPPYNTGRNAHSERALNNHEGRYDIYVDTGTHNDYVDFSINLFNHFDNIVKPKGVVLYNINYGADGTHNASELMDTIANIINNTNWDIGDIIVWKKKTAIPSNVSSNKLTRIFEFIFVLSRKSEIKDKLV